VLWLTDGDSQQRLLFQAAVLLFYLVVSLYPPGLFLIFLPRFRLFLPSLYFGSSPFRFVFFFWFVLSSLRFVSVFSCVFVFFSLRFFFGSAPVLSSPSVADGVFCCQQCSSFSAASSSRCWWQGMAGMGS